MQLQYGLSIVSALLENAFYSGVVFGWPMLQYILAEAGYFCDTHAITGSNTTNASVPTSCEGQESKLNLIFTLSSNIMLVASFFLGYMLDRFGTWVFRSIMTFSYTLSYVFLAVSSPESPNFLFSGMIILGTAGIGLLLSNLQLVQLTQTYQGIVSTLITGMFDSAAVVFLLIKVVSDSGVALKNIFQVLTLLTILPWIKTFILMPKRSIPIPLPSNYRYGWRELICFNKNQNQQVNNNSSPAVVVDCNSVCENAKEQIANQEAEITFLDCLRNKLFWTNCFHFTVITFRVNFFIGSLVKWVDTYVDSAGAAGSYASAMGIWLLFSCFSAPLNGTIIDMVRKFSKNYIDDNSLLNVRGLSASMFVTSLLSILLSIMVLIPSVYGSYACLLFLKTFIYGGSSTLLILIFPPEHLGKLFGLNNIVAGTVGMLQFPLFNLSQSVKNGFTYIHIGFCVLTILTLVHPLILYIESNKSNAPDTRAARKSSMP